MKTIVLFLGLLTIFSISYSQKKIIRQAAEYEAAGLFEKAAEEYMQALYKNAKKPEALLGLKRNAQKVIDSKLSEYFILRNSESIEQAISKFDEVLYYQKRLKYFEVNISIPSYYIKDYENDKEAIAENSKNLREVNQNVKLNNLYETGERLYHAKNYAKAWSYFDSVRIISNGFKETDRYLNQIESLSTTVAVVSDKINRIKIDETLRNMLIAEISQLKNPFIKMVSRDNLATLIEEQKLGISGVIDEQSAVELGKLLGVKAMIITKVINQSFLIDQPSEKRKTAYLANKVTFFNSATQSNDYKIVYQPVFYDEVEQMGQYFIVVQYQLISVETAEILKSDIVDCKIEERVHYAHYMGDSNALYHSEGNSIYTHGEERVKFLNLFMNERKARSETEIAFEAHKMLAKKMALSIVKYFQ